jgi:hypothetical protein
LNVAKARSPGTGNNYCWSRSENIGRQGCRPVFVPNCIQRKFILPVPFTLGREGNWIGSGRRARADRMKPRRSCSRCRLERMAKALGVRLSSERLSAEDRHDELVARVIDAMCYGGIKNSSMGKSENGTITRTSRRSAAPAPKPARDMR